MKPQYNGDKDKDMAFTDEDRNILIQTKTKVDDIERRLNSLPCQEEPPRCMKQDSLDIMVKTLSNTRAWIAGIVATLLGGGALALLAAVLTHLARGG